jgi:hypothetical protein
MPCCLSVGCSSIGSVMQGTDGLPVQWKQLRLSPHLRTSVCCPLPDDVMHACAQFDELNACMTRFERTSESKKTESWQQKH